MNLVVVKFEGTPNKEYSFNTRLNLMRDGIYEIVADNRTVYNNKVKVVAFYGNYSQKGLRTITEAKLVKAPPKPGKPYKKIFVNLEKETVCVLWHDNVRTVMKPQPGDTFDVEKGIALCFMKRWYGNRGCFNDVFKDIEVV